MLDLLTTRVRIPPDPHRAIQRRWITDTLERDIPHFRLIVVSAPAGYGKTTALAQWAKASQFRVAWLSLSEEDNDLERFLRCIFIAWETIQSSIGDSKFGLLLGGQSPDMESTLSAFLHAASELPSHTVFVLDDYHLVDSPDISNALIRLLDHLPPNLHFVLASRDEPPLPLARYRARQHLKEYRAEDLQFSPDETTAFLTGTMGLELGQDDVATIQDQLEGWIAGLQLIGLTLQKRPTLGNRLDISGRHRFIADYLNEDVLEPLHADIRGVLLQTSVADRLCASLCDAITGRDDGQQMLERLEQERLFLVALDDRREWFRYHHLFRDFLREQLDRLHSDQIADLHSRAARWYLDHDLPDPAFRHAHEAQNLDILAQIGTAI